MLLITDLPRDTGVGQYVSDLSLIAEDINIYFRKQMSPIEYNATTLSRHKNDIKSEGIYYAKLKFLSPFLASTSHVTWEGFGLVLGRRTKLITVHHVITTDSWTEFPNTLKWYLISRMTKSLGNLKKWNTHTVVPSNEVKSDLIRYYNIESSKITVIPHAIDTSFYREHDKIKSRDLLNFPENKFLILTIGHDDIRKNILTVYKAYSEAKKKIRDLAWVHVGKSELLNPLSKHDSDIFLLNDLKRELMPFLYNAVDLVLLLSFKEGFSYTLLETLACGTPVLTSNLNIFKEQLGEFYDGLPVKDFKKIGERIVDLYENKQYRHKHRLRSLIEQNFTMELFKKRYSDLYEFLNLK